MVTKALARNELLSLAFSTLERFQSRIFQSSEQLLTITKSLAWDELLSLASSALERFQSRILQSSE